MKIVRIDNMNNDIYHNSEEYADYWSSSNIKEYLKTPNEAIYQKQNKTEKKQNDALIFGNQLHDYLASKHVRGQLFEWNIFEPPKNKKGEYFGKKTIVYSEKINNIINPISSIDMEIITDIWELIRKSEYNWFFEQEILNKGVAESSFFITDNKNKYKYRPDVLTDKYIFDYKSVDKKYWSRNKLNYRIYEFGYDISAAMYQYFEFQRTGIWKPFFIIWLMKNPPFDILISDISEYCYQNIGNNEVIVNSGALTFIKLKEQHELCSLEKNWPGLSFQFDNWNAIKLARFSPRFDRNFDKFKIK